MSRSFFRPLLAALWLLVLAVPALAAEPVAIPKLSARVTDLTATLSQEQRTALEASLAAIEQEKGAQVGILLLPTVKPETIEEFGIRLADAWKLGRKGVDDGVIVIVAKNDRKMRIEVGYGLEGAIPDAVAKRIIAERMAPAFKKGDFAGGLSAAVVDLAAAIGTQAAPAAESGTQEAPPAPEPEEDNSLYIGLTFAVIMFASVFRWVLGLAGSFVAAGLAGWLATLAMGHWIAAPFGAIIAFASSGLVSLGTGGGRSSRGSSGFSSGGDSSWSSSSSDSDSSFSGGGGDSGGGGASGDW